MATPYLGDKFPINVVAASFSSVLPEGSHDYGCSDNGGALSAGLRWARLHALFKPAPDLWPGDGRIHLRGRVHRLDAADCQVVRQLNVSK